MPSHTLIEEIDEILESYTAEQLFRELLQRHDHNPKKFLAATFAFLKQGSAFFDDPEASKVLARLLRDTKGPAGGKSGQGSHKAAVPVRLSL